MKKTFTSDQVERATLTLLGKDKNPAPTVDWWADRHTRFNGWKALMVEVLTEYVLNKPKVDLSKPDDLAAFDAEWNRQGEESMTPYMKARAIWVRARNGE